jgi:hypothetical protein
LKGGESGTGQKNNPAFKEKKRFFSCLSLLLLQNSWETNLLRGLLGVYLSKRRVSRVFFHCLESVIELLITKLPAKKTTSTYRILSLVILLLVLNSLYLCFLRRASIIYRHLIGFRRFSQYKNLELVLNHKNFLSIL